MPLAQWGSAHERERRMSDMKAIIRHTINTEVIRVEMIRNAIEAVGKGAYDDLLDDVHNDLIDLLEVDLLDAVKELALAEAALLLAGE